MTHSITPNKFSTMMTRIINKTNIRVHMFEKRDLQQNVRLSSHIAKLFVNANFEDDDFDISEIDYVLSLLDETNVPVAFLVLREYNYSPRGCKLFLHIEYGITSKAHEGKGYSTLLRKLCLAFAYVNGYGGVSSYAIAHGSQIPLQRMGFKAFTPMKYKLTIDPEHQEALELMLASRNDMKLNAQRESEYEKRFEELKQRKSKSLMKLQNAHMNANTQSRVRSIRRIYYSKQAQAMVNQSVNNLKNQYLAEVMLKYMPENVRKGEWLSNGQNVKGLYSNKGVCPHKTRYRPFISHVFTFASQKRKLFSVVGDWVTLLETESKSSPKRFTPKVKSMKPKKAITKNKPKKKAKST